MSPTNKPPWTTIEVQFGSSLSLSRDERLALLFRWIRTDAPRDARFVDTTSGKSVAEPLEVSWAGFPLQEAIDAAMKRPGRLGVPRGGLR